jgi:2,3,4,5-tetrahydropyridine-2-carboxylate N-succinyltransferase
VTAGVVDVRDPGFAQRLLACADTPAGAVVVPGARQVSRGWGRDQGVSLQTPVIVKYRDERTDVATALEGWLR